MNDLNPTVEQLKAAFVPLKDALIQYNLSDIDMLNLIGGYARSNPVIAQALTFHARDYLTERGTDAVSYSDVIVEMYWRTFFDPEVSKLYGTAGFFPSLAYTSMFANNLADRLNMDRLAIDFVGFVADTPQIHQ